MTSITFRSPTFITDVCQSASDPLHLVLIATKPDIIKQVPVYKELTARGHRVILGHTGQHFDDNLSGGMLREFGVEPDFNLNVRGVQHEVISQIIERLGSLLASFKEQGRTVIPYVHGDTTTAMAAATAAYCHGYASVHVEAGIRTLTPDYDSFGTIGASSIADWHSFLQERSHWKRGSQEPYPEQFNTRCSEAGSGIHLAPVELDREFLLAEGYAEDRIFVVGNSVVDAVHEARGRIEESDIFNRYPLLAEGNFVRFCIHRRENCSSESRFRAIVDAMKSLVMQGRTVLLISLFQTEAAIDRFGLRDELQGLCKRYPHFLYMPVWSEYTDVIAAMSKASVCATDSGSMQEEMNVLGVPCVTLRFGSDRSESVMAGGNLIAPPSDSRLIASLIEYAWDNSSMRSAPTLYGSCVCRAYVDSIEAVLNTGHVFRTEEDRLQCHV